MRRRFNVVFLDFDGVLNHQDFLYAAQATKPYRKSHDIDPSAVALVNDLLVRAGNAAVVISSSWRCGSRRTEICDILNERGFKGTVLGMTPQLGGPDRLRGDEIQRWLDDTHYGVDSFVILDDDSDMGHLLPRLVKTTFKTGLLPEHIEVALAILKDPYVPTPPKPV